MLFREGDQLLEEREVDTGRCGIVREARDDEARARPGSFVCVFHVLEEVLIRSERNRAYIRAGERHRERMDRVGRLGHETRIARRDERPGHVADRFLRAHRAHRFGFRVEHHVVPPVVPVDDRLTQLGDPAARRVAVVPRVLGRFRQLVDDVRRRREIGVAHTEVDDVLAGPARARLEIVDDVEDVRREAIDAAEFH